MTADSTTLPRRSAKTTRTSILSVRSTVGSAHVSEMNVTLGFLEA